MCLFFVNDTATTEIYTYGHTLSLHDALPISLSSSGSGGAGGLGSDSSFGEGNDSGGGGDGGAGTGGTVRLVPTGGTLTANGGAVAFTASGLSGQGGKIVRAACRARGWQSGSIRVVAGA